MNNDKNTFKKGGLLFLVGLASGYIASLFVSDSQRDKQKEMIADKAEQFKELVGEQEIAKRVKDIYKKNTAQVREKYFNLRDQLADSLSDIKGTFTNINEDKYLNSLEKVLQQAQDDGEISDEQLEKLRSYFKKDFSMLQRRLKREHNQMMNS